jgi:hypothetical protein
MPVILGKSTWDQWVNPGLENLEELHSLLRPAKWCTPEHYPVSMDVGKVDKQWRISAGVEQGIDRPPALILVGLGGAPFGVCAGA